MSSIGDTVRRARLSAGLTQAQLADEIGCSQAYISVLESGKRRFNEDVLESIAAALGISAASLVTEDERDVWQEGFAAGVAAARHALDKLDLGPTQPTSSEPGLR